MAQALFTRGEIKNRHCEGTEQALSLSHTEDKKKSDNYNINNKHSPRHHGQVNVI